MINFENVYEDNSAELALVKNYIVGATYITEDGTRIKYLGFEDDTLKFKVVNTSPLVGGAKISEFEKPNGLKLFWIISNKILNNEYTYQN